jgi:hypothetical protein
MTKTVTPDTHLKALALFTMGAEHYKKAREYEIALSELLGYPEDERGYCGCLSDAIYNGEPFQLAFKKEGFTVERAHD